MVSPVAVERIGLIVGPELDPSIGVNIQGPSLIRVPDWLPGRMGDYYLYFADHKGSYIRLAVADRVEGPWRVYAPGSLHLAESLFPSVPLEVTEAELAEMAAAMARAGTVISHDLRSEVTTPHIASPDVHVDHAGRRVVMYYHGLETVGRQVTRVATSVDGVRFVARPEVLGASYLRVFRHAGMYYGLTMPGLFSRSRDGMGDFEAGPLLFERDMRHAAVLKRGDELLVFWTRVGDVPERILLTRIDISGDWRGWRCSEPQEVLRPAFDWEGADAPLLPSVRSTEHGHVNQLRDPAELEDGGEVYMAYAVAGESGIALGRLRFG